jgi:type IV secretory pathway protease TraF
MVKGAPAYDAVSLKRVDANTSEQNRKKDGKTVQTVTRKVSADGKTMTVTTRGKDENGRTINTIAVYDRVSGSTS